MCKGNRTDARGTKDAAKNSSGVRKTPKVAVAGVGGKGERALGLKRTTPGERRSLRSLETLGRRLKRKLQAAFLSSNCRPEQSETGKVTIYRNSGMMGCILPELALLMHARVDCRQGGLRGNQQSLGAACMRRGLRKGSSIMFGQSKGPLQG